MGLSEIKTNARLAIHERMAEPCIYTDRSDDVYPTEEQTLAGLELTVRFHTKTKVTTSEYDALSLMEGIEALIFIQPQLDALGITLEANAAVTIPGYNITLQLDSELDPDGPIETKWTVTRA